ncbi:MAG: hypothetical protein LUD81_07925 [Clostridiales bacterium]|nr:hypothetical protein [Clostridiales bacterium]
MEEGIKMQFDAPLSEEAIVKALFGVSVDKFVSDFKCGKYDKTLAEIKGGTTANGKKRLA